MLKNPAPNQSPDEHSIFFTTYNRTQLQEQVRDLINTCNAAKFLDFKNYHVVLCATGQAAFWSLLAAPAASAVIADCGQLDVSDDQNLLPPGLFCPGIRNIDTFAGAAILAFDADFPEEAIARGVEQARWPARFQRLTAGPLAAKARARCADLWLDGDGQPFMSGTFHYVGGCTKLYGAAMPRLRESDFGEVRTHDGISPRWPVSYAELEPFYARAERLYGVHGDDSAEHRVDGLPRGFHRVLPGEQPAVAV